MATLSATASYGPASATANCLSLSATASSGPASVTAKGQSLLQRALQMANLSLLQQLLDQPQPQQMANLSATASSQPPSANGQSPSATATS